MPSMRRVTAPTLRSRANGHDSMACKPEALPAWPLQAELACPALSCPVLPRPGVTVLSVFEAGEVDAHVTCGRNFGAADSADDPACEWGSRNGPRSLGK